MYILAQRDWKLSILRAKQMIFLAVRKSVTNSRNALLVHGLPMLIINKTLCIVSRWSVFLSTRTERNMRLMGNVFPSTDHIGNAKTNQMERASERERAREREREETMPTLSKSAELPIYKLFHSWAIISPVALARATQFFSAFPLSPVLRLILLLWRY